MREPRIGRDRERLVRLGTYSLRRSNDREDESFGAVCRRAWWMARAALDDDY